MSLSTKCLIRSLPPQEREASPGSFEFTRFVVYFVFVHSARQSSTFVTMVFPLLNPHSANTLSEKWIFDDNQIPRRIPRDIRKEREKEIVWVCIRRVFIQPETERQLQQACRKMKWWEKRFMSTSYLLLLPNVFLDLTHSWKVRMSRRWT